MSPLVPNQRFVDRRYQAVASLGLLACLVAVSLVTDLLARNRRVEQSLMAISTKFARENNTLFSNTGNFIDFEERLLLDEISQADYSNGGIYFFGTSNMKWAFTTWDLPAKKSRIIGNYGIGASNHTTNLRLIEYLIDQRGFLTAGDRNLVILGVSFALGRKGDPSKGFFVSLLRRHGLYGTTPDGHIVPVPMSTLERWLRIEKARSGGFIWNLGRLAKGWAATIVGSPGRPTHDGAKHRQDYREFMESMGPDWQQSMDAELERLRETIVLLHSHHAQVEVMLLPMGTWVDELPFKSRYDAHIRALCQATSTPLTDLSHVMADETFVDGSHFTVDGQEKFRALIMGEISEHLEKLEKLDGSSSVGENPAPDSTSTTP